MKKDITTPEIQWLARLVDCKGKEERSKAWEKKIMQHRISLKRKEIKMQRRGWDTRSSAAEELLPNQALVTVYRRIKQ